MFDRALAPRPPTAWQADPTLFEGASASDFAAWRIAPLQGELSDLSREALARFEADLQEDTVDGAAAEAATAEAQALPFKRGLASIVTHFVPDGHGSQGPIRGERASDTPEPRADEPATLKLGTICERLGVTMTAAFLADVLHVKPARTDGRAVLFRESQFPLICRQLQSHVSAMAELYVGEVAA